METTGSSLAGALLFGVATLVGVAGTIISEHSDERKLKKAGKDSRPSLETLLTNPVEWKANLDKKFNQCVYLDYNASTPVFPEVGAAMIPFITSCFGNPSSGHLYAKPCRDAISQSRKQVAELIGASDPSETILFTCSGSESDNWAIDIALYHYSQTQTTPSKSPPRVVTSAIEHPAIMNYLKHLEAKGRLELVVVGVDHQGFLDLPALTHTLTPETALVTIMHSNNEIGTIQPIRDISRIIEAYNTVNATRGARVLLHSDAAQSIGKVPVSCAGIDLLSVVGHKYGAPKGIAALYVRTGIKVCSSFIGGGQENGRRAGTENVLLIKALGVASEIARNEMLHNILHFMTLKLRLINALTTKVTAKVGDPQALLFNGPRRCSDPKELNADIAMLRMMFSGSGSGSGSGSNKNEKAAEGKENALLVEQLPNTVSVSFRNINSMDLILLLNETVACSTGSACHHGSLSAVLQAVGCDVSYAYGTLRLSVGRHSTAEEVDRAAEHIAEAVALLTAKKKAANAGDGVVAAGAAHH